MMTMMMLQGVCTVRSLRNISNVEQQIKEPVVANNATASTVAFIAPGPPNPPITQVHMWTQQRQLSDYLIVFRMKDICQKHNFVHNIL